MNLFFRSILRALVLVFYLCSFLQAQDHKITESHRIKVKFEATQHQVLAKVAEVIKKTDRPGLVLTGIPGFDKLNQQYRAIKLTRLFPDGGKFEERRRKHGLHLWYEIEFESGNHDIPKLLKAYQDRLEISIAEPYLQKTRVGEGPVPIDQLFIPNDPRFQEQWHYMNTGQTGGTAGSDIKLNLAWTIQKGDPSVIVAVIDGGVDINHADLAGNLWRNLAELNGQTGVDDDGNGYVDDIHGYSFVDRSPIIFPENHGTHVAGTIAAMNDNGIGVSGIAGGSRDAAGVRLMSCAVFSGFRAGGFEQAFVYAADNGAVIAQNSWGYVMPNVYEQSILDAIDYFIDNAGIDIHGNQTGPMAGGIVIFAAGNSNSEAPYYPAYYERVMAVASTNHNDKKANYSNYGNWIDVSAPGGETLQTANGAVLSTMNSNSYGFYEGTSMACPHVSGVAALIVSQFGKPGFSPAIVWDRITKTVDYIDDKNPFYQGKLGSGRLNAYKALQNEDTIPPAAISDLTIDSIGMSHVALMWTATGGSGTTGIATFYDLRYSQEPIDDDNFENARRVLRTPNPAYTGSTEKFVISGLAPLTTYYFAIKAGDFSNNISDISNIISATTSDAPIIAYRPKAMVQILDSAESGNQTVWVNNEGPVDLAINLNNEVAVFGKIARDVGEVMNTVQEENEGIGTHSDLEGKNQSSGGRLFGSSFDQLVELDPSSGEILAQVYHSSFTVRIGMAFDGRFIYFTNGNGKIYKRDTRVNFAIVDSMAMPPLLNIESLAFSGDFLYAADNSRGDIHEIDYNGKKIIRSFNTGVSMRGLTFGGDRQTIYMTLGSRIQEYDLNSNKVVKVIQSTGNCIGLAYSQALGLLFAGDSNNGRINAINPETGTIEYFFDSNHIYGLAGDEYLHPWLNYNPVSAVISAGDSLAITVNFDGGNLRPGNYQKNITIHSNDPVSPKIDIPVLLHINGTPIIAVSRDTVRFNNSFINYTDSTTLVIRNTGTDSLAIENISVDNDLFSVRSNGQLEALLPGLTKEVTVFFHPVATGVATGTLTITSNAENRASYKVHLMGNAFEPPVIVVSADSIFADIFTGEVHQDELIISNHGGSDLIYTVSRFGVNTSNIYSLNSQSFEAYQAETREPLNVGQSFSSQMNYLGADLSGINIGIIDPYYYSTLLNDLAARGASIVVLMSIQDVINRQLDILILDDVIGYLDYSDISFIKEWVSGGKGLLLMGDNYESMENINRLISGSGIFQNAYNSFYSGMLTDILPHYLTKGIDTVKAEAYGSYSTVTSPAQTLVYDLQQNVHLAVASLGMGNIVVAGNEIGANESLVFNKNRTLVNRLIDYLASSKVSWLGVSKLEGTIPVNTSDTLHISLNSDGLYGGAYKALISIYSNDPEFPVKEVDVSMHVTGAPNIAINGIFKASSTKEFSERNASTSHGFSTDKKPAGKGEITILLNGDFAGNSKYAEVIIDDMYFSRINPSFSPHEEKIYLSAQNLTEYLNDSTIKVEILNSYYVNVVPNSSHQVSLGFDYAIDSLLWGNVYIGDTAAILLNIENTGTDSLRVLNISSSVPQFFMSHSAQTIAPGDKLPLTVYFSPSENVLYEGQLRLESNAKVDSLLFVKLAGKGIFPPNISVHPDFLSAVILHGDTLVQSLTIDNSTGGSKLDFSISVSDGQLLAASPEFSPGIVATTSKTTMVEPQPPVSADIYQSGLESRGPIAQSEPVEIEEVLAILVDSIGSISEIIPNRFNFSEGESGSHIMDGGNDMYDWGNYLRTNIGGYIQYSNRAISTSQYLGNQKYFTLKGEGLFIFASELKDVSYFEIDGNLGADGMGSVDGAVLEMKMGGNSYLGFVKRVYNAGDPSVNHLVIVQDNGSVNHCFSTNTDSDFHQILNLNGISRLYYLLYAGSNGYYINNEHAMAIMEKFLSLVETNDWLTVDPLAGSVEAGESLLVKVKYDGSDLYGGLYYKNLQLKSNDPIKPMISVPVELKVVGTPRLIVEEFYDSTSVVYWKSNAAASDHRFAPKNNIPDHGILDITVHGNYAWSSQYADVYINDGFLKSIIPTTIGTSTTRNILSHSDLQGYLANGSMSVRIANSYNVNFENRGEFHKVKLQLNYNADSVSFGELFIGDSIAKKLMIGNVGTDTLFLSLSSSADVFLPSISQLSIPAKQDTLININFIPLEPTDYVVDLVIRSNDPADSLKTIKLSGLGLLPPILEVSVDSLNAVLLSGDTLAQEFTIGNSRGGNPLIYSIDIKHKMASDSTNAPDDFIQKHPSSYPLTCIVTDPTTGLIYGQEINGDKFYRYNPDTEIWSSLAKQPLTTGFGGAVYYKDKIYTTSNNAYSLGIYDIKTNSWETYYHGTIFSGIATDGEFLYMMRNNFLYRFNPNNQELVHLSSSPGYPGFKVNMSYHDGHLYVLSCLNNIFLKYDIHNDSWISLQDTPLTPVFGSAMDYNGNFYSFGYDNNYSSNLLVFNAYTEKWDIKNNPLFNVSDGGMTFVDHKHIYGLYFVEGSNGNGLGFYQVDRSGNWLSCHPVKDTVPEGTSSDLTAVYRTDGMVGGKYFAEIMINNNDPLNKQFSIPVTLEVVGAPNIFTSTDTVVFDTTFVDYSTQQSFVIRNSGTDTLRINSITLDNDDFAIDSAPALILPRNASVVSMTFSPSGDGLRSGTIEILNNDINKSPYHIKAFGVGLFPPEIAVNPDSMLVTLYSTDSLIRMLHVYNNGRSDLHMDISIVPNQKKPASHIDAGAFLAKLSAMGGYDIVNNENGTIGYRIDEKVKGDSSENTISTHRIATLNNDLANVKVLFTDNRYNSLRITLESMGAKTYVYSNTITQGVLDTLDVLVINDYLYPYTSEIKAIQDWVSAGGSLFIDGYYQGYYYNQILSESGIRYVNNSIYYNISNDITRHFITREIQEYEVFYSPLSIIANKGAIDLIRDSRDKRSCLAIDTIGRGRVLASTGDSFMHSYFYAIGHADVAINAIKWLSGKDINWLKTAQHSYHVEAGNSVEIPIGFLPKGLYSGTYNSHLIIASNDPVTSQVMVPIEMTVIGVPEISTCDSVVFDNAFVGQTGVHLLNVMNCGTGILTISEFLVDQPFVVNSDPFSIQPEDYAIIPIFFMPGAHGSYKGALTLKTNQRDSLKTIYLSGLAFDPPEIRLNIDSIDVNMTVNRSEKHILTITNHGKSELTYSIIKENIGTMAISPEFASVKEGTEYVQVPERDAKSAGNIAGEPKLEEILKNLLDNVANISEAIPNRYDFSEGVDGHYIIDGGNDMYDVGNLLYTDRGGYINYSDRAIRVTNFFGYPGNYFTFKGNGVFILAADIDINLFDINGDLGADGFGSVNGAVYNMKKNGLNYLAFVKRVYEAWSKPSVNHMIIVQDNGKVGHEFSTNTNNDYHRINNLSGIKRLYYLLFAGSGGHYFDDAACKKIMETFLDVAVGKDWLTVDKETGTVKPGLSENIEITLASNDLGCGLYQKVLTIFSNDPLNEHITLPVDMNVYSNAIKITASSQEICEGAKATLSASGGKSYIWNTGSLGQKIDVKPKATTTYSVMGYDFNGCIATDSFNLKVNPVPKVNLGSDTTVSITQRLVGSTFILKAGEAYVSYIWSDGSTGSKVEIELNEDLPEFKTYWVKVTDANSCVGVDTVTIRFALITNIDNREMGLQAEIYPNPTNHYLTLKPAFANKRLYVEIRNLQQQLLFSREYDTLNLSEIRIDVSGLAAGIYIILFESEQGGMGAKKFMVK